MENELPADTLEGARRADWPRAGSASSIKEKGTVRITLGMVSGRRSDIVIHRHVVAVHARCDLVRDAHSEGHRTLGQ